MTDRELDAIAARCEAATPGPWEPVVGRFDVIAPRETNAGLDRYHVCDTSGRDYDQMRVNAAFIAHSRQDIPALLAEVRRLRALLCPHCRCRADHPQPCHCENDE